MHKKWLQTKKLDLEIYAGTGTNEEWHITTIKMDEDD